MTAGDERHAWAVATTGTIIATSDGGATWTRQRTWHGVGVVAITCADSRHAWAVGDDTILATSDGGTHWRESWVDHTQSGVSLSAIAAADTGHLWAVGDRGINYGGAPTHALILATANGGVTWTRQSSAAAMSWEGVAATDAAHAWAVTNRGMSAATSNGGVTWESRPAAGQLTILTSVAFAGSRHGWVAGYDFPAPRRPLGKGIIMGTFDGGVHWQLQRTLNRDSLYAVAAVVPRAAASSSP